MFTNRLCTGSLRYFRVPDVKGTARVFRSKFGGIGNSENHRSVVGEIKHLFQKTGVVCKDINMISTIRSFVQF